jgi:hypothetical protein
MKRKRKLSKLVKLLDEAKVIADEMEITLSNGGEVGSLIGSMVDELALMRETPDEVSQED